MKVITVVLVERKATRKPARPEPATVACDSILRKIVSVMNKTEKKAVYFHYKPSQFFKQIVIIYCSTVMLPCFFFY